MPKATVWRIFPFSHILLRCQDTNVSIQIILHISVILISLFLYIYFAHDQVLHCTADVTFKNSSPTRWLSLESFGFVCRICSYHLCWSRGSLNRKHNQKILHKFLQSFCTAETESKQSFLVLSMQSECKPPWSLTLHYWNTKKKIHFFKSNCHTWNTSPDSSSHSLRHGQNTCQLLPKCSAHQKVRCSRNPKGNLSHHHCFRLRPIMPGERCLYS